MKRLPTSLTMLLVAVLYLAAALLVNNAYHQLIFTLVLVWACFGLSWNMLSGYTGLVSFGHAAFFGLGAYSAVLGQVYLGLSPWVMLPLAGVIGAVAGVLVGVPTFRLRGHYFALAMLAYPLALLYVFEWLGLQEMTFPMQRENPGLYMQFADRHYYTAVGLVMLLVFVQITLHVERTRFGMALIAIKQNEAAAEAAGIDTLRWKLCAIALSGAIAGVTGAFYAVVLLVVTPVSVFGMLVSAQALTVSMFGGVGSVWGPIIGAAILVPLGEILHAELGGTYPGIQGVILGVAIIAVILIAPEGVFWKLRDGWQRRKTAAVAAIPAAPAGVTPMLRPAAPSAAGGIILDVQGVSRSFGGLKAVQDVSFSVRRGMILGIIGPNGAGKTTLFNLLNGFLRPDTGRVLLNGVDMAGRKPHVLCAAGVGRTFQVMRPFMRLTVAQNVKVGAYVRARDEASADALTAQAIARVGLSDCTDKVAALLTTRELRLMELARAVAGQPELLLLDETLAGLGHGEVDGIVDAIRALSAEGITVVIIEHTMQTMVRLVDEFLVLDHGQVLTRGDPQSITQDPQVVQAYLGKKWSAQHAA
ncbi:MULTISPECIES: ATP-binding cassette domain-containing protein [unclassified Achromobacter]|uniref:branched-chain amino acid ABC transporter ATP-binding protein/permease n=1 Tax=unclassified Achromobacter TaxID=2626865 RepID=UPI000B5168A3|nr:MULTISPECIES: branched-chain amino acid ABC transporter ATP-binding protein/permease [unclassified Achromobacter]OWT73689.1 branched-chain amino acid ABC transporter [Achromobacter sp. HZ34]OWT79395.1 branched-chain amino acid ABC transporter [Achromobacter sp. HZ28]